MNNFDYKNKMFEIINDNFISKRKLTEILKEDLQNAEDVNVAIYICELADILGIKLGIKRFVKRCNK